MKIQGLPECLSKVYLADLVWSATGEGYTRKTQLVYSYGAKTLNEQAIEAGLGIDFPAKLYPAVIEKELHGQKYLDNNPEFESKFLTAFGPDAWAHFWNICGAGHKLDLKFETYYNLS